MKGTTIIIGSDRSMAQLLHMFNYCNFRFETGLRCEDCSYNISDDDKDTCELYEITMKLKKCTGDTCANDTCANIARVRAVE